MISTLNNNNPNINNTNNTTNAANTLVANASYSYMNSSNANNPYIQSHTTNLIEEFFFIYDEDNKLINLLKDEFSDLKFFNYGSIVYLQKENEGESADFPHVSELLENYEKIYSKTCFKGNLILRLTKCNQNKILFYQINYYLDYIIYNDGFMIVSDNGFGSVFSLFKIRNILICYNSYKGDYMIGKINSKILRIFKNLNLI